MAEAVGEMAKAFYKIDVLKKQIRLRKQMVALRQNKVAYGKSRLEQGGVDEIQVKLWTNSARATQISLKTLEADLQTETLRLKALMGYHPDYYLPLDTRNAVDQVLGGFNGRMITFSDIQAGSFHLRIAAKKEQLQSLKTEGTYAAILPRPVLLFQSASGLANVASGLYLAIGFNHTLWDGFRRIRDIKRQKMEMRSLNLERHELSKDLYNKYRQIMALLDIAGERESFEQEQDKLVEQNEERAASRYKSGIVPFEDYMDARIEKADADINAIRAYNDRVGALIDLATLAGGLNRYNARLRF
jgi:outer membrane protein TolC